MAANTATKAFASSRCVQQGSDIRSGGKAVRVRRMEHSDQPFQELDVSTMTVRLGKGGFKG